MAAVSGVTTTVDPITFEVVNCSLTAICEHMANSLRRTANSPIIHDAADFSCALHDLEGNLIAQQGGCPIHLGTMPYVVKATIEKFGLEGMKEGDIFCVNDPYLGSVHLNDVAFVAPYFWKGELVAFVANRAHWPDIGGYEASGVGGSAVTHLFHEGLVIPPVRIREEGRMNQDLLDFLMWNVRGPEERMGDLYSQVAAIETGIYRLDEPITKYSLPVFRACMTEALQVAERRMREAIRQVPDGVYSFEDQMDDDGVSAEDIKIRVTITVSGDRLTVDFTGTGGQVKGAINSAWGITYSTCYIILKALLDPFGPNNSGWYKLIEFILPEGSLVNPERGRPVFGGPVETGLRIKDCIMGALAEVMPEKVIGAPYGTIDTSFMSGIRNGHHWIYNDWIPGGWGGRFDSDGISCMIELIGNTDDIPIEVAELKYPLRYRRSELRTDSGGPGKYRGGLGTLREIEVTEGTARACIQADRTKTAPWGIFGGMAGARTRYSLVKKDGQVVVMGGIDPQGRALSAKRSFDVGEGEALRIESAGGGGYGDPKARDKAAIIRDVRAGYVSREAAVAIYGLAPEELSVLD